LEEQWTIRKVLDWAKGYLRKANLREARLSAETLLAQALGVERLELYLYPDRMVKKEELAKFKELIIKHKSGVPLQYLLGEVDFLGCCLKVTEAVLIPRFETEELVERILRELRGAEKLQILDLGTGSGAIAIALAKSLPDASIVAVDISEEALKLAKENAKCNAVAAKISFLKSDWFAAVSGTFDLIVANPPYVASKEFKGLPAEVLQEPRIALDGGARGLREISRIVRQAPNYLKPGGKLYLEIAPRQAEEVKVLLLETGAFSQVELIKDLAGKDRIIRAVRG